MIDFRSDTVTRPTAAMRAAMVAAEVGDDVWGDDPTVNRLQQVMAERTGKDAALFFPSGTQSNLAAVMAHCERGDEYIVGQDAHTYKYEGGGAAVLGSVQPQPIENAADGTLPLEKIAAAIKPLDFHFARTRLLALENTSDGRILPAAYVAKATDLARGKGLSTHLDGARLCNAAVGSRVSLAELCRPFDSISICFSKGLGAPVGSVLVGSIAVIDRASRWRKVLGGGLRQSGILAAACLFAFEHHYDRLAEDHLHAESLAAGLATIAELSGITQATNMVFAHIPPAACVAVENHLQQKGILASISPRTRFVTHLDVSSKDVVTLVDALKDFWSRKR